MNADDWRKFARYVQPGTQCKYDCGMDDEGLIIEGILLENYPYAEQERIAAYTDHDAAGEAWQLHNVFPMLRHVHGWSRTEDLYPANMMYFYVEEWDGWYDMDDIIKGFE